MRRSRTLLAVAAIAGLPLVLTLALVSTAAAHGSMGDPPSRTYLCFLEGPETPQSAACQDAVAIGGTQALYDWHEVNLANADGRHRELIPDGRLCSAGRDKYRGFEQARADWPAATLPTSGTYTFRYRATAPHQGWFELYVTRDGYDPTQPLRWDDLEPAPFLLVANPPLVDGHYVMTGQLPAGKQGRHLIYSIWQRTDSPEAFYTCSDVVIGGEPGGPEPTASPTVTPSPSPSASPTSPPDGPTSWAPHTAYQVGDLVSYQGQGYECRQAHTSLPGWEPPAVAALWQPA